ncbi:MAG: hypothetical protein R3B99_02020 [Polyangiales bacterium]
MRANLSYSVYVPPDFSAEERLPSCSSCAGAVTTRRRSILQPLAR